MVRKLGLRRCDTGCMIEMHLLLSYWYIVLCIQQHGISVETEHEFAFSVVQTHCLQLEDPDSRTCLFMAICYTHSHTTQKQKLKSTSGSILLLEGDLFLFAVIIIHFGLDLFGFIPKPWWLHVNLHNMHHPFSFSQSTSDSFSQSTSELFQTAKCIQHQSPKTYTDQGVPRLRIFPILGVHARKTLE